MKTYEHIIIGAGIAGCSLAYFLNKSSKNTLLIDKNSDVAFGASGVAGAFLSPLLGKDNEFKNLVTKALKFSIDFYKQEFSEYLENCGTLRIPKNRLDDEKFQEYIEFMDFEFYEKNNGYFFPIGSSVKPYEICKKLTKDIEKLLSYEVKTLEKTEDFWLINSEIKAKNIFLTTGANIKLIDEPYFDLRAVWGQKIDILSSTKTTHHYHKECSVSKAENTNENNIYKISIGATHNRFLESIKYDTSYNLDLKDINNKIHNEKTSKIIKTDNEKLLKKANDIIKLEDVKIIDIKIGARASSVDYFPMIGLLVDSVKSIEKHPHIVNGSFIKDENLIMIENLYTLNGLGGRGFVLSPYLAKILADFVLNSTKIDTNLTNHRLFKRWAKRLRNKN